MFLTNILLLSNISVSEAKEDVQGYMEELAEHSNFFKEQL